MRRAEACGVILAVLLWGVLFPGGAWPGERCAEWVIRVDSVQGAVEARKPGEQNWVPVKLNDTYCTGVMLRVGENARAAIGLRGEGVLRIKENSTVVFTREEAPGASTLLNLLRGAAQFFSRDPRGLTVNTPYLNAGVEGTEFFIQVLDGRAFLSVFEGRVSASNPAGSLSLTGGQSAVAEAGSAPRPLVVVRPRDAVQWALHYPPVLDYTAAEFPGSTPWEEAVRHALALYGEGDLTGALAALDALPEALPDPRPLTLRAGLLLSVGQVEKATRAMERALDPFHAQALALQSVIATTQNEREKALDLAQRAVDLNLRSSAAWVARSYARQAAFDLEGALADLAEAVRAAPENALAWARLAELRLSLKHHRKALEAARRAVALNPKLSRAHTVLGFAHLIAIRLDQARESFWRAIERDQADPLPRLGLGLALIRGGDLQGGRREIEIAVSLDPGNALLRSYLGKAYFDEKRDALASRQFEQARQFDPQDPTPWFYEAILKETQNRPVEALEDLEQSIRLNDNRAVYRSRLMLDEDLAARSASLARIYQDLGFESRALVEGWKSLNADPANYSAHRFLSDTYATMPRHDIARVSELLQAQLLQPLNVNPVQPQMGEKNLLLPLSFGPASPSFSEYTALFARNRADLLLSGVVGEHGTYADEAILSGLWGRFSGSLGQFHYQTDGLWENNDLERNIHNAFFQAMVNPKLSLLAEYRNTDFESGELTRLFNPGFDLGTRDMRETESIRFGMHGSPGPRSDLIAHVIYRDFSEDLRYRNLSDYKLLIDGDVFSTEAQHLFRSGHVNTVVGAGHMDIRREYVESFGELVLPSKEDHIIHDNIYAYTYVCWPTNVTWTLGGSGNFVRNAAFDVDRNQFNPKIGLTWNPVPATTLRAAAFRTLMRSGVTEGMFSGETIEPTQVAGFNQFFDDAPGTRSWRYGVGIDQKLFSNLYSGVEISKRAMDAITFVEGVKEAFDFKLDEQLVRAYLYWAPHPWLGLSPEFHFERFKSPENFPSYGGGSVSEFDTYRLVLGLGLFHPLGLLAQLKPTLVFQDGKFVEEGRQFPLAPIYGHEESNFFVLDAVIGYRLPKRHGFISIEARNLFDKSFKFQEAESATLTLFPERWVIGRVTVFF